MDKEIVKPSFVIYRTWMEMILALPDDTALDLTRTMFAYCLNRDYEPGEIAAAIFDTFEPFLERDIEKWYATREGRAKAGSLGGKQKVANAKQVVANAKQNVANAKQMLTDAKQNLPVYVNVNVDGNVDIDGNVNVNDKESKREGAYAPKREIVNRLMERWNAYTDRGQIPAVRSVSLTSKTGKSVLARLAEFGEDTVNEVMDSVFQSDYLRGFKTDWCAKFDWMFLPSNFEKIRNGNYDNRGSTTERQCADIDRWVDEIGGVV